MELLGHGAVRTLTGTEMDNGTTVDYVWYTWEKGPDGKITYVQNKS